MFKIGFHYFIIDILRYKSNFSKRNIFVTLFCMLKLISFILHVSSKFFTSIFKINILFSKLGYEPNFFLKVYYVESTNPQVFLLYLKNSIFYELFNETSQIFQFFFLTFFQHQEF